MNKKKIIILIMVVGAIGVFVNTFINSRREHKREYNFIIQQIIVTPTKQLDFYDGKNKIRLWNFGVSANSGIKAGDILRKGKCSDNLYIFRKDANGTEQEILKVNSTGIFPIEWFCSK